MASRRQFILAGSGIAATVLIAAVSPKLMAQAASTPLNTAGGAAGVFKINLTDAEWRARLTPEQYKILRQGGDEHPYSSPLYTEHRSGTFACAGCELPLFSSRTKFESHTGWPSFWAALDNAVGRRAGDTFGMYGIEVHCTQCGGILGHVFDDGPKPTGLRHCINGVALKFTPQMT